MAVEKVVLSWSGGKDSALALHALQADPRHEVVGLLTTVAQPFDRVSHHGVRSGLIQHQADSIGLPLKRIMLPAEGPDDIIHQRYEDLMRDAMLAYRDEGIHAIAFGDVFLEDLRNDRESNLARVGIRAVFPIWGRDTRQLLTEFVGSGFQATVSCVVTDTLDASFAGRQIDPSFITGLPDTVDPCGEYGEYHSFVSDGPMFSRPIGFQLGERVYRDVRCFVDLIPMSWGIECCNTASPV